MVLLFEFLVRRFFADACLLPFLTLHVVSSLVQIVVGLACDIVFVGRLSLATIVHRLSFVDEQAHRKLILIVSIAHKRRLPLLLLILDKGLQVALFEDILRAVRIRNQFIALGCKLICHELGAINIVGTSCSASLVQK